MDRTMISFNLPNIISITLMAAIGYLIVTAVMQVMMKGGGAAPATNASGSA